MRNNQSPNESTTSTPTEVRAGRVVGSGAIRRVLLISIPLAVIALLIAFFFA